VRREPGCSESCTLAGATEELREGRITEWVVPATSPAPNKKQKRTRGIARAFGHDIGIDGFQRGRFMEIDQALDPTFRPEACGMILAATDDDPPPSVGDILQMQREHFAGT
jgi:hypothetical protein